METKQKIKQIINRNTEGNYLLSYSDKEKMINEIYDLFKTTLIKHL
jgi:hypothetical protein